MLKKMSFGDDAQQSSEIELKRSELVSNYIDMFMRLTHDIDDVACIRGNVLLNMLLPDHARQTKDLDFSVLNVRVYNEILVPRLTAYGDECVAQGIADSYVIRPVDDGSHPGGIKVKKDGRVVIAADISASDDFMRGLQRYKLEGAHIQGSSVNRIVSDKVCATLSKARFRRTKDFYDLFIIHESGLSVDYNVVRDLCVEAFGGTDQLLEALTIYRVDEDAAMQLSTPWEKLRVGVSKETTEQQSSRVKPTLADLLTVISKIYRNIEVSITG